MSQVTIFHNPRCSKSRETLALLESKGCDINIVEYLKQSPSTEQIQHILTLLGKSPREVMRTKELEYKALELDNKQLDNDTLIQAIVDTPKLLERPIVLANNKAAIGRPPESVLAIL